MKTKSRRIRSTTTFKALTAITVTCLFAPSLFRPVTCTKIKNIQNLQQNSNDNNNKQPNQEYINESLQQIHDNAIIKTNQNDNDSAFSSNLMALIHIGPMKTGSSAIQHSMRMEYMNVLKEDNYEVAGTFIGKATNGNSQLSNFMGCMKFHPTYLDSITTNYTWNSPRIKHPFNTDCHNQTIDMIRSIGLTNKNHIIMSAEYLTNADTDIQQLKDFVTNIWSTVRIVAYYRRYFDWILSFHNQAMKNKYTYQRESLVTYLQKEFEKSTWYERAYIVEALNRWKVFFPDEKNDIVIMNMYDVPNNDIIEGFFCQGIMNATQTCAKRVQYNQEKNTIHQTGGVRRELSYHKFDGSSTIANRVIQKKSLNFNQGMHRIMSVVDQSSIEEPKKANPSQQLIYSDLAYYAYEMKLWNIVDLPFRQQTENTDTLSLSVIDDVADLASEMHKQSRQLQSYSADSLSPYDFVPDSVICPSEEVYEYLLNKSIQSEELIVPNYHNYAGGKEELISHFQEFKTNHKFCHIDAKMVLEQQSVWRQFFQSLKSL